MSWRRFLRGYAISIFLAVTGAIAIIYGAKLTDHIALVIAIGIFFLIGSPLSHHISTRIMGIYPPAAYTLYCLVLSVIKMIVGTIVLVIYSELHPAMDITWVWPYLYVYFVFTIFDVRTMMLHNKE